MNVGDIYEHNNQWFYWDRTGAITWDGKFYESEFGPFESYYQALNDLYLAEEGLSD